MKQKHHRDWYTVITAILVIGFLLVLTVGGFQLVLQELYDGRGKQNYLKAYAAAEAGLELALYKLKEDWLWYGYYEEKAFSSDVFSDTVRQPEYSYEFLWKAQSHTWQLWWVGWAWVSQLDIIPLFWISQDGNIYRVTSWLEFQASNDIVWNIVWQDIGVWWSWNFHGGTSIDLKELQQSWNFHFINSDINSFLATDEVKYLFVYNTWQQAQQYNLTSTSSTDYFTLPRHDIISSGKVWNFRQNIRTSIDNTEYLWLLRYSIFAWD